MKSMRILTFAAAAGAGVAGQLVGEPAHAPAMAARHECSKLPALCTGAVTVSGTGTTLTYLCPTTQVPVSTVHVTVTATTTVTSLPKSNVVVDSPHGPSVLASTGDIPASGTPHAPAPPGKHSEVSSTTSAAVTSSTDVEVTTTTTIHSTLTTEQTITLTRKTSSLAVSVPSPTAINSTHGVHSVPTPTTVTPTQLVSASSATGPTLIKPSHRGANSTDIFHTIPSSMPPFSLVTPSAVVSANKTITTAPWPIVSASTIITASESINTTAPFHGPCFPTDACWKSCATCHKTEDGPIIDGSHWATATGWSSDVPWPTGTAPSGGFPIPTSDGTIYSKLPIARNASATRVYTIPTPQQARGLESSESAKPSKTGGVGAMGVSVAALMGGVVAAVYFA